MPCCCLPTPIPCCVGSQLQALLLNVQHLPLRCGCPADPFPPSTTTLDNPAYRWFGLSLMKGAHITQLLS